MSENTVCTFPLSAATWEQQQGQGKDFDGLILTVDLDRGGAGVCRCRSGQLPELLWETAGTLEVPACNAMVRELLPECAQTAAVEALLREASTSPWVRSQKNYLRGNRQMAVALPSLVVEGRTYQLSCGDLDQFLVQHWDTVMTDVLSRAQAYLRQCKEDLPLCILPVGALARVFLAEYRVREVFLELPLVPDPRIRTWEEDEDPSQIIQQGEQLYLSLVNKPKLLPCDLRLQVQRLDGQTLKPELVLLAEKDTPYEQLTEARYAVSVVFGPEDPLVIFADSRMHRFAPGFLRFAQDQPFCTVEIGIGLREDQPAIFLRSGNRNSVQIALNLDNEQEA